ncbi:3-hydroxylacyl-ACP dehydratase [Nocardia cyriacigeorgica]|uniref:3-hydroxylacyl-ACP dehydratase n=1 Tax=Nocardia cyriacigeorgica TaxID=135487 RepID=UPI00189308F2|nr:3-hydroxylacyl-ACP dehydratase [Nocardia cyriacigeorgica]MBF6451850.1 3-hydroxylacyl-ACP dehydratase [Nocardia cyriacigeorgica]MBF6549019.1 3-hydroxylacyl-ACP dehydratase [Nocardia cyriacigeorgica]
MRFHLVDRIDAWEAGRSATGRKLTSHQETYWVPDDSGRPAMPSALVLESVCQTATWLVLLGSELSQRATLLAVEEVRQLRTVRPGDVLDIEVRVESMADTAAVVNGVVRVDGEQTLTATRIMCGLMPADELDDPTETRRLARLLSRKELVR